MDIFSGALFAVIALAHALGRLFCRKRPHHVLRSLQRLFACPKPVASVTTSCTRSYNPPPRPWGLPVLGNMINLGMKPNPYECMTDMSRQLGAVYGLRLGSTDCVVVNDMTSIREVLVTKGDHFDGRPNFNRYSALFGGDRDNCEYLSARPW